MRIDKYLWAIRIFKTRTLASKACDSGRVKHNGMPVKASKTVAVGDHYEIKTAERKWMIEVIELLPQRKAYSEAIKFYVDLTPDEDKLGNQKMTASFYTGKRLSKTGKPSKKERRDLDDFRNI